MTCESFEKEHNQLHNNLDSTIEKLTEILSESNINALLLRQNGYKIIISKEDD